MIKLLTIIGARPQIIKAAALSRAISSWNMDSSVQIEERILHTGQHYDENMSQVFFEELGIPQPDYNLHVGSGKHGEQTAKMIAGIETVLLEEKFDGLVVYGDTNSTIAGAIAASKLHIPIFHIEAGLRSNNMHMPEEVNRIACDHLSSILFTPTQTGYDHLEREGLTSSIAIFPNGKKREVHLVGDLMYDNSLYFAKLADTKSTIIGDYDLKDYILATVHRDNNTDDRVRLSSIFRAFVEIANNGTKIVLPLHPRTKKLLPVNLSEDLYNSVMSNSNIVVLPPASFLDMVELEKNASLIMTDSGGVQKEAFFFEKPCVILRPETEWVEIVNHKAGIIADADYNKIMDSFSSLLSRKISFPALFGDGHSSEKMLQIMVNYLK